MTSRLASFQQMNKFLKSANNLIQPSRTAVKIAGPVSKGFTLEGIKKNAAVIPLVVIISIATIGVVAFSGWSFYSRNDIDLLRRGGGFDFENMDVMNPKIQKLRVFGQEYKPLPELHSAIESTKPQ
uniref:Putative membrane protein n=1 Tax=Corethrella appendiculata TaxID=1370023 RepID=U5ET29_9DIPT